MPRQSGVVSALVMLTIALAQPAQAHRINVFATVEGKTINGYVYFPGGGRANGAVVTARAPDDARLGEATTNERGEFTIAATMRCDHTLIALATDGHRASYVVFAAELPGDLPAYRSAAPKPSTQEDPAADVELDDLDEPLMEMDELIWDAVRGRVAAEAERAVGSQVRPLREQIQRYEERVRLRDVLGGIGYIVGMMGLSFYFLGRRRRDAGGAGQPSS